MARNLEPFAVLNIWIQPTRNARRTKMRSPLHPWTALALLLALAASPAFGQRDRRNRGPDRAPTVGTAAPEFEIHRLDSRETVALADARRDRPVVLIFGSYT